MFRKLDNKWRKVIKESNNRTIYLDSDNALKEENGQYIIINWIGHLYAFPSLDTFKISNLPNKDRYPKISVTDSENKQIGLKIYDIKNLHGLGMLSYGIRLGFFNKDLDNIDIKEKILKESI